MKKQVQSILLVLALVAVSFTVLIQHAYGTIWTPAGTTWSPQLQLTNTAAMEWSPSVAQTKDGKVWVFWHAIPPGGSHNEIFYKTYNGTAWSGQIQFTNSPSYEDINPAAAVTKDGKIWVFWTSDSPPAPPGVYEIYYRTSSNNGLSWSALNQLTSSVATNRRPAVMVGIDGNIWVAWYTSRDGNEEIYYNHFDGIWPGLDTRLTNDPSRDIEPAIAQSLDGRIWIFWSTNRTGNFEIFYKVSSNGAQTWSTDTQLTFATGSTDGVPAAIGTQNGQVVLLWSADRTGSNFDIYSRVYDGSTWGSENAQIIDNSNNDLPAIYQGSNSTIWVAWSTDRNGDYDIYYMYTNAQHDVAVTNVTPFSTQAYQGCAGKVKVTVKNAGQYSETFRVTAYYNSTAMGTQTVTNLAPNSLVTLTFSWNTTQFPYGNYAISATSSQVPGEQDFTDNTLNGGTVFLTIPGDVNGDRTVNVQDAAALSAHWSPLGGPYGPSGYDPRFDINEDTFIDIVDAGIISAHWGQSW